MCIGLTPLIISGVVYILTQKNQENQLQSKNQILCAMKEKFVIIMFLFNYLFQITLMKNMVQFMTCIEIDGVSLLKMDFSMKCEESTQKSIVIA